MSLRSRWSTLPARWLAVSHRGVRARLTMLYGGLFLLTGTALLAITYLLVDHTTAAALFVHSSDGQVAIRTAPGTSSRNLGPALGDGTPTPEQQQLAQHLLAQANTQHDHDLHQLLTQSGIALAIMTIAAIALGWLMAGRALQPLRAMTNATQRITERNLDERLALSGPNDEIKRLADTIDGLLSRLEAAFDAQKHFVANASHELRTPLALNRTLLEVALADRHAGVHDLRSVLQDLLASSQDQERLIDALLTLASSERGLDRHDPVDLVALTDRVVGRRAGSARRRNVEVSTSLQEAATLGSPRLIERLIANLIDNAIQHNVPGGHVDIRTRAEGGEAVLQIINSGPAITPDAVSKIVQPFERVEDDRTNHTDGHGLGLSIVRAIAVAHGAGLKILLRAEGGLDVRVHFPTPSAADNGSADSTVKREFRKRHSPVAHR